MLASQLFGSPFELGARAAHVRQTMTDKLVEHLEYTRRYGQDLPEVRNWPWPVATPRAAERSP